MIKIDKLASEEGRIRWLTGMTPWLLAMLLIGDAIGCLATKRPGGFIGSNSALFSILTHALLLRSLSNTHPR
ncbi:MAG: hypothetical protein VYE81_05135 [Planctomycetota bacterium]|nr:hypothetical protein [Planctomycetota bacterium]